MRHRVTRLVGRHVLKTPSALSGRLLPTVSCRNLSLFSIAAPDPASLGTSAKASTDATTSDESMFEAEIFRDSEGFSNNDLLAQLTEMCREYIALKPPPKPGRPRFMNPTDERFFETGKDTEEVMNLILKEGVNIRGESMAKVLPVQTVQDFIDILHDYIPYWSAIMVLPFLAKMLATIPMTVLSQKSQAKNMARLPQAMREFREAGLMYQKDPNEMRKRQSKVKRKFGFHPMTESMKPMVGLLVQIPVHMTCFVAVRRMFLAYPDFRYGGFGLWTDLSIKDPTWALCVGVGLCTYISMVNSQRMQRKMNGGEAPQMFGLPPEAMKYAGTALAIMAVPVAHLFTTGFNLYICANTFSYVMQHGLVNNDSFRGLVNLPPASWQAQYARELKGINAEMRTSQKTDLMDDKKYEEISSRANRRRQSRQL